MKPSNNPQLKNVAKSFYHEGSGNAECHNISTLSRRIMLSRQTVRRMLAGGELEPDQSHSAGPRQALVFSSEKLDGIRRAVVDAIVEEIEARLRGLDLNENEIVLAALHGLRAQKRDIEFAARQPEEEESKSGPWTTGTGAAAAVAGGVLGNRVAGARGALVGGAIGAAAGTLAGGQLQSSPDSKDFLTDAALAGGIGYGAHRLIQSRGGYANAAKEAGDFLAKTAGSEVAQTAKGRILAALRRATARAV